MNDDPRSPGGAEPVRSEELAAAFRLVFQHLPAAAQDVRVANALQLVSEGQLDPGSVLAVRDKRGLLGAIISLPIPGSAALVWPPQTTGRADRSAIDDQLVQALTARLRQRGTKLAQALLAPHESFLAAPLLRNGFRHVTTLWYMRHHLDFAPETPPSAPPLAYVTYADGDRTLFHLTLLRTYEQTLDCPEVTGVRTIAEVMEGHRSQGLHDPRRWWLALHAGRPVGVLLLTEMPDLNGWDLSYLGLVPEARRHGFGRLLTLKAITEARQAAAGQLTLSVDARNRPAWSLYQAVGFEPYDRREVYLAIWAKG